MTEKNVKFRRADQQVVVIKYTGYEHEIREQIARDSAKQHAIILDEDCLDEGRPRRSDGSL